MRIMLAVLLLLAAAFPAAADLTFVADGASRYEIVLSDGATAAARLAATELQSFVEKSTGAKLPIVALASPDKPHLFVGPNAVSAAAGVAPDDLKPGGFHLRVLGQDVHLVGQDTNGDPTLLNHNFPVQTGTLTAVYEFLERFLGVMFCWDDDLGTVVPRHATVTLPAVEITQNPAWGNRDLSYAPRDATYALYGRRLRLGWDQTMGFGHNWYRILPAGKYGKEHPEYFALVNGKRVTEYEMGDHGGQVCTSNPAVIDIFAQAAIDFFKANPEFTMFSVCPNDGGGFCECANCRAIDAGQFMKDDPTQPVLTDRMIHFYNAIAEKVAKVFPDKRLGAYVYSYYQNPPVREKIIHPMLYLEQATNSAFTQGIGWAAEHEGEKQWVTLTRSFDKYDIYYLSGPLLNVMAPLTTHLIERLKAEQQIGMHGGYLYIGQSYEELGAGHYLLARMMWDKDADPRQLEVQYYNALYGPAGPDVKAYYDLLEGRLRKVLLGKIDIDEPGLKQFSGPNESGFTPAHILAAYWPILDAAETLMKQAEGRQLSDLERQRLARLRDHHDLLTATIRGLVAAGRLQVQTAFNPGDVGMLKAAVDLREDAKRRLAAYAPTLSSYIAEGDKLETALVSPSGAFFQMSSSARPPQVMALRTAAAITVDGRTGEAAWQMAPDQYFNLCKSAGPAAQGARAKLLYDDRNLYVFVEGREPRGQKLLHSVTGRDDIKVFDEDNVEIMVQPAGTKAYYHLALGAGGGLWDCSYPSGDERAPDMSWESGAQAKAVITPGGWSAELAIPWSAFGPGAPNDKWRINVYRTRRGNAEPNEYTALCPTFGGYHELGRFGTLKLLDTPPSTFGSGTIDDVTPADAQKRLDVQLRGGASMSLDADRAYCGRQAIHFTVPPGGLAAMTLEAKVRPGASYRALLEHVNSKVTLDPKERDQAPITRVIFRDDAGQAVTETREYSWDGVKALENPDQWRLMAHVFKTPEKTTRISFTIFFFHPGEYWVDEVRLEEL
jgi:hypothetical protein